MARARSRSRSRSQRLRQGWGVAAPRGMRERRSLARRCGAKKCFLRPSNLGYPICSYRGGCKVDCRGLSAARYRAGQMGASSILAKANRKSCGLSRMRSRRRSRGRRRSRSRGRRRSRGRSRKRRSSRKRRRSSKRRKRRSSRKRKRSRSRRRRSRKYGGNKGDIRRSNRRAYM